MRQADRLLKTIYRERFIRFTGDVIERQDLFNFQDESFRTNCKTAYLKIYPQNYSGDELDEILNSQSIKLNECFQQTNSAFIFPYYAKQIFKLKNKQINVAYEHLLEWDGFQNKVDSNVFIGAYAALQSNKQLLENTNIVLTHDNERIYQLLNKGVCEGHMHLKGSGLTTELSWTAFLKSSFINNKEIQNFIKDNNNFREFKSYGYTESEILLSLLKVKLVRIMLDQEITSTLKDLFYSDTLTEFKNKVLLNIDILNGYLEELNRILNVQKNLPSTLSERLFYEKMFVKLLNNGLTPFEMNLFNFYIWGASVFKFELNQDNVGMGFQKFKNFENVKDQLINDNELIYRSVFEKYYEEGVVRKIEFRIAPKDKNEIHKLIQTLDRINKDVHKVYLKKQPNLNLIEYGLIIHYIKRNDFLEESKKIEMGRFTQYLGIIEEDARVVENVLEWEANLVNNTLVSDTFKRKIIAIDAANTEVGCPPEIFGLYFRKHRDTSDPVGGINFTFHVGEEFKTLESGIRNVDETIDYLAYRRGDRLGHALALGLQANKYFEKKRYKVVTTVQEYIDNIVWLYGIYSQPANFNQQYVVLLNTLYEKNCHLLFRDDINLTFSIANYLQSMRLRGDDSTIYMNFNEVTSTEDMLAKKNIEKKYRFNIENSEYESAFTNKKARILHYNYLNNYSLICNGKKPIEYEINEVWICLINDVQRIVRNKLIDKGIVVEANPSSNRKISSVQYFSELPFLTMNTYLLEDKEKRHVSITINTDDSAIFQTNLSNEYSLIARSLEVEGFQPERIYNYLNYLRESSCIYNFVR